MPFKRPPYLPYLALGLGVVCLGFSAIFLRAANAPGVVSSFYRMAIGTVVFTIPFLGWRRRGAGLPSKGIWLALLGGLFFGVDMALWSTGVMISGATNPTLMANTAPAWVGIGAFILFRERLNSRFWIGLLIALTGAAIILGVDSLQALSFGRGTLYGLIAAIFYGGFFLIAQRGRIHMDAISFFWFSALASTLVLFLIGFAQSLSFVDYPAQTFGYFLAAGLVSQVIGWFTINYAQGYLPATVVSPSMLGQPMITAMLAVLLLHEGFTGWQALGGAAIIGGIWLVHRSRER